MPTGARALLKSPERFRWEREHPVIKDVFDVGTAAHLAILEREQIGARVQWLPYEDFRTKAAQQERDAARAEVVRLTICDCGKRLSVGKCATCDNDA